MKHRLIILLIVSISQQLFAQELIYTHQHKIQWTEPDVLHKDGFDKELRMHFEGAWYAGSDLNPLFHFQIPVYDADIQGITALSDLKVEPVPASQVYLIDNRMLDTAFTITAFISQSRETPLYNMTVKSIRLNPDTRALERLVSFESQITLEPKAVKEEFQQKIYADNSILATGNWHKFGITTSGVYKISASDLQAMGINPSAIDPRNIRIFGNGGAPLPEKNAETRIDDLAENPILVVGEDDGRFDQDDYILLYAQGPVIWKYNLFNGFYYHRNNYYDNYSYFFITTDLGSGLRIQTQQTNGTSQAVITDFLDYAVYEKDLFNLSNTGRTWYGELFDVNLKLNFEFAFPNAIKTREAFIMSEVASRNFNPAKFIFTVDGQPGLSLNMETTTQTGYSFAKDKRAEIQFFPTNEKPSIQLEYQRTVSSSRGWLDYISVNVWRELIFSGPQMHFRNPHTVSQGNLNTYKVGGANQNLRIWDVTNPNSVFSVTSSLQGNVLSFDATADEIRQFVAFDGSSYLSVENIGKVENQNLHAVKNIDYLIISHPDFLGEAERLANFHRIQSGLQVYITTPNLIYNEFSSGAQDITAIRDFVRMLYLDSDPGRQIRYLLLFGDASFDYKNILTGNSNFVPTWQSLPSLNIVSSIATDDYYGFLDEGEGGNTADLLDIGIGRFPVASLEQARHMVDKVLHYSSHSDKVRGPWRNTITFVADDSDGNLHMNDAEYLYRQIDSTVRAINIDKVYLDAYQQISTPSGQKAPDVNEAINKRMDKGSLIMNYSGHGGEVGWGHERFLEIADINSWNNFDKMPVFITATCEFSRYDDAQRTSAGEMVILNPKGGAIAMFTTARATYASANRILNLGIFQNNMFIKLNGEYPRFGDIIRRSKLRGDANDRKFVLLGDPALQLALPAHKVITSHINEKPVGLTPDTLRALDIITIKGFIMDDQNNPLNDYNGILYPTVYDKASTITTKGDENGYQQTFQLRNSIIYNGKTEIVNGQFEFSFMMPKDIAYQFGTGRISYYGTDLQTDASGYYEDIIVGGFNQNTVNDNNGPHIRLFMNDTSFVNGGMTNENPILLALVEDENGINTTGTGIGHDIVASLNGATVSTAILNDFYESELNRQASGIINYPFRNLNPGKHTVQLKVWDVFNNSSEASIEFEVIGSQSVVLNNLINFPNPFTENTNFVFDHNQTGQELDIQIRIYDLSGRQIKMLEERMVPAAYKSTPVTWDGRTDTGQQIAKGLYLYRLRVTNEKGVSNEIHSKLIYFTP